MTTPTLDDLTQLEDGFYEAAFNDEAWAPAMSRFGVMFNAPSSLLAVVSTRGDRRIFYGDCPPEFDSSYFDPDLSNPFIPYHRPTSDLVLFTEQSIMPRSEFRRSTFYNEWMVPQDAHTNAGCNVPVGSDFSAVFGTMRGGKSPEFDGDDLGLLERLAPTIARACMLRVRTDDLQRNLDARAWDYIAVGQIVVDRNSQILSVNARALDLITAPDGGMDIVSGRLVATDWSCNNRVGAMIASACSPDGIAVRAGGDLLVKATDTGRPRFALSIAPYRGPVAQNLSVARTAVILIRDLVSPETTGQEQRYRDLFGLTQKEAELAAALAAGRSLQSHAHDQSVSIITARTHLGKLFAKTGTSRQGELIALLNRAAYVPG